MQKSLWAFYPPAIIFTLGHWLGAIKIRFGHIRLARRIVRSALNMQATNIVFFTLPVAKNSNSLGFYHPWRDRNQCPTCKNRSGLPPKNILSPGHHIYPWPLLGSMRSVIKTKIKFIQTIIKNFFFTFQLICPARDYSLRLDIRAEIWRKNSP